MAGAGRNDDPAPATFYGYSRLPPPRIFSQPPPAYREVIEGQFLDFTLAAVGIGDEGVNEAAYIGMANKKSAVLVGAAVKVGGMISSVSLQEEEYLWQYGLNLGLAYQLYDDLASLWGDPSRTGKYAHKDIIEKKKTLPILYAASQSSAGIRARLREIYTTSDVTGEHIQEVLQILGEVEAYEYVWGKLQGFAHAAKKAAKELSLGDERKDTLLAIVDALLPEIKKD